MQKQNFWNRNFLLEWIQKIPKGLKMVVAIFTAMLAVVFWMASKTVHGYATKGMLVLFFATGYVLWCCLIDIFVPMQHQVRISQFVLVVFCLVAVGGGLTSDMVFEEEKTLICSEISPDGTQVAEGYSFNEVSEGTFLGKVYVKNTSRNRRGQYISYEVYVAENLHTIELYWIDEDTLVVNGETIEVDYSYE